tara:strand:- start:5018 stop:6481 length:1464 start_codon:yes stop_codon:yes gene_type:complete
MSAAQDITKTINDDPIIKNLFLNDTDADLYNFDSKRSANWIRIPTSYTSEDGKKDSIGMMSLYTYNGEQSEQINASISNPDDIGFSNDGHVSLDFKTNQTAKYFYPNPVISDNTGGTSGQKPIGIEHNFKNLVGNYTDTFFLSGDFLFSPNLRWILYKKPDLYYKKSKQGTYTITKTKSSSTIPMYLLLYNPIHRKKFQDIYSKIINATLDPFSNQSYAGPPNTSYLTTIKKYCNAFKIEGENYGPAGNKIMHYADPGCCIAIDMNIAKLSQALNKNITQENLENKYYLNGKSGYEAASKILDSSPSSDAYCSRGSGYAPSRFLREKAKVVVSNGKSDSFLQILTNYVIGTSSQNAANMPSDWSSKLPGNTDIGGTCQAKSISIVNCTTNVSGDVQMKGNKFSQVCGNKPPVSGKKAYTKKPATKKSGPGPDPDPDPDPDPGPDPDPDSKDKLKPTGLPKKNNLYIYILVLILLIVFVGGYFLFKKK